MSKGVSEIVATVLMILMVSTIGMGVFIYSMGYFSGITSARYETNRMEINAIEENFRIVDAIVEDGNPCKLSLAVYNYGDVRVDLRENGMYVNGIPFAASPVSIEPRQTVWFNGTYTGSIADQIWKVRIVSQRGTAYDEAFVKGG
ncbi:MAG: archaellin/type IV pilin N-terminal domain-containing protein [Candidatus Methanosuratincola petrocarbonis]